MSGHTASHAGPDGRPQTAQQPPARGPGREPPSEGRRSVGGCSTLARQASSASHTGQRMRPTISDPTP
jgi:hypothetical protein